MEIINYSENAIYSGQKNRFRFTGNRINQSRYSSAAIVMPRNYGARNFVLSVKSAFSTFFKIFLTICKFIWIVPAVAACIYYPWKSVEKMAHEKSFALPVELDADNERSFAYLDEAIASFAREKPLILMTREMSLTRTEIFFLTTLSWEDSRPRSATDGTR